MTIHLCGPWDGLPGLRLHVYTSKGHLVLGTSTQVREANGRYGDRWRRINWTAA